MLPDVPRTHEPMDIRNWAAEPGKLEEFVLIAAAVLRCNRGDTGGLIAEFFISNNLVRAVASFNSTRSNGHSVWEYVRLCFERFCKKHRRRSLPQMKEIPLEEFASHETRQSLSASYTIPTGTESQYDR